MGYFDQAMVDRGFPGIVIPFLESLWQFITYPSTGMSIQHIPYMVITAYSLDGNLSRRGSGPHPRARGSCWLLRVHA